MRETFRAARKRRALSLCPSHSLALGYLTAPNTSYKHEGLCCSKRQCEGRSVHKHMTMYQVHFFRKSETVSLPAAGFSWHFRLRGTQGGRVYTRRKFGPRPGPVTRALGVRSRAKWRAITGSLSAEPVEQDDGNPTISCFCFYALLLLSCRYHTILQALKLPTLVAATAQQQSHVKLFHREMATDGVSACTCACHVSCRPREKERTYTL